MTASLSILRLSMVVNVIIYSNYTRTLAPGSLVCMIRLEDHENLVCSVPTTCVNFITLSRCPLPGPDGTPSGSRIYASRSFSPAVF